MLSMELSISRSTTFVDNIPPRIAFTSPIPLSITVPSPSPPLSTNISLTPVQSIPITDATIDREHIQNLYTHYEIHSSIADVNDSPSYLSFPDLSYNGIYSNGKQDAITSANITSKATSKMNSNRNSKRPSIKRDHKPLRITRTSISLEPHSPPYFSAIDKYLNDEQNDSYGDRPYAHASKISMRSIDSTQPPSFPMELLNNQLSIGGFSSFDTNNTSMASKVYDIQEMPMNNSYNEYIAKKQKTDETKETKQMLTISENVCEFSFSSKLNKIEIKVNPNLKNIKSMKSSNKCSPANTWPNVKPMEESKEENHPPINEMEHSVSFSYYLNDKNLKKHTIRTSPNFSKYHRKNQWQINRALANTNMIDDPPPMFSTPKKSIRNHRNIISYDSRHLKKQHLNKKLQHKKIVEEKKISIDQRPISKRKRIPIMRGAYVSKRGKKSRPDIQYLTVHTSTVKNVRIFRSSFGDRNHSKSGISRKGQKINRIFKAIPVLSVVGNDESDGSSDDIIPMVNSSREYFSYKSNSTSNSKRKTPIIRRKHNKTVIERLSHKPLNTRSKTMTNKYNTNVSNIHLKHQKSMTSQKSMISINSEIDMRTIFTEMNLDCDPILEIAFGKFFNLLDIEQQGMISVEKFLETLTALNINLSTIEIKAIRNEFSRDIGNIYLCTLVQYLMGDKQSMNISKKLKKYTMVHQNIRYQILDRLGLNTNSKGNKARDSEDEDDGKMEEKNVSPTSTTATFIFHAECHSNNSSLIPTLIQPLVKQEIIHGFANIAIGKVNEYLCSYKIKIERNEFQMLSTQHQRLIYCFSQMFGILDEGNKGYLYDREIQAFIDISSLDGKYLLNDRNIVSGADIIHALRYFCCRNERNGRKEFNEDIFNTWLMEYVLESLQISEYTNTKKLLQTISGIDSCIRNSRQSLYYQQMQQLQILNEREHANSVRNYMSSESCTTPPSSIGVQNQVYNKNTRRIWKI